MGAAGQTHTHTHSHTRWYSVRCTYKNKHAMCTDGMTLGAKLVPGECASASAYLNTVILLGLFQTHECHRVHVCMNKESPCLCAEQQRRESSNPYKKWFRMGEGGRMPFAHTSSKSIQAKIEDNAFIVLLSRPYQNMSSYSLMGDQWTFLLLLKPTQGHPVLRVLLSKQAIARPSSIISSALRIKCVL